MNNRIKFIKRAIIETDSNLYISYVIYVILCISCVIYHNMMYYVYHIYIEFMYVRIQNVVGESCK